MHNSLRTMEEILIIEIDIKILTYQVPVTSEHGFW